LVDFDSLGYGLGSGAAIVPVVQSATNILNQGKVIVMKIIPTHKAKTARQALKSEK